MNGGTCIDGIDSFTCDCTDTGFFGETCEEPNGELPAFYDCMGTVENFGDGYCDSAINNEACGFDGGDCCPSTCDDAVYACGGSIQVNGDVVGASNYNCLDPTACENTPLGCPVCAPGCPEDAIGDGVCGDKC